MIPLSIMQIKCITNVQTFNDKEKEKVTVFSDQINR